MSFCIAVAGKGGTGKTSFSALAVSYLLDSGRRPVLAVDADPNSNLNESLGVQVSHTLGDIRDETLAKKNSLPAGMTKQQFIEYQMHDCLVESEGFDFLAMGRTEGPDCYCYVNNLLRGCLNTLIENYSFIVMDNEAGMEHLSRRTTRDVDALFVISDCSFAGLKAAGRINKLSRQLKLNVASSYLVINKTDIVSEELKPLINATGLPLAGTIPFDETIAKSEIVNQPLIKLPGDFPAVKAVADIIEMAVKKNN